MRTVIDTNVVVSGLLWQGPPRFILDAVKQGKLEVFTSRALLNELEHVLSRKKFAARIAQVGGDSAELRRGYLELVTVIDPGFVAPIVPTDPDDDEVLAAALAAHADVIVTGDRDLLDLIEYNAIKILTAPQLLAQLA